MIEHVQDRGALTKRLEEMSRLMAEELRNRKWRNTFSSRSCIIDDIMNRRNMTPVMEELRVHMNL